jgi:hypothetical protein
MAWRGLTKQQWDAIRVHLPKKTVVACLMTSAEGQPPLKEVPTFRTMTAELLL